MSRESMSLMGEVSTLPCIYLALCNHMVFNFVIKDLKGSIPTLNTVVVGNHEQWRMIIMIDDTKWNERKARIAEWFNVNPQYVEERESIAVGLFKIGETQPEEREKYWAGIRSLFAGLPNPPIGPGRQALLSVAQKSAFDLYLDTYYESKVEDYETNVHTQATARQHGKSGGMFYHLMGTLSEQSAAYATDAKKKMRHFLLNGFNANQKMDLEAQHYWPTETTQDKNGEEVESLTFNANGTPNVLFRAVNEEE